MIDKTAEHFEKLAKRFGLSVRIPRPGQTEKSVFSVANGLIGLALLSAGAILKRPSLVLLGGLGIAGAAVLSINK